MKKYYIIIVIIFFFANIILAQTENNSSDRVEIQNLKTEIQNLNRQITDLKNSQSDTAQKVEFLFTNNQSFLNMVDSSINYLYLFAGLLGVILVAMGVYDRFKLSLNEKDIKLEAEKIKDKLTLEMAFILQKNPFAIKEFIDQQTIIQENLRGISICILYQDDRLKEEIKLEQLVRLNIEKINEKKVNSTDNLKEVLSKINDEIIFVADGNRNDLCNLFNEQAIEVDDLSKNYFYYGEVGKSYFPKLDNSKVNYANSKITIDNNLISLVRSIKR